MITDYYNSHCDYVESIRFFSFQNLKLLFFVCIINDCTSKAVEEKKREKNNRKIINGRVYGTVIRVLTADSVRTPRLHNSSGYGDLFLVEMQT